MNKINKLMFISASTLICRLWMYSSVPWTMPTRRYWNKTPFNVNSRPNPKLTNLMMILRTLRVARHTNSANISEGDCHSQARHDSQFRLNLWASNYESHAIPIRPPTYVTMYVMKCGTRMYVIKCGIWIMTIATNINKCETRMYVIKRGTWI